MINLRAGTCKVAYSKSNPLQVKHSRNEYQQEFNAPGKKFIQPIDLNQLQSGFYNVRIISNDKTAVKRLVIFKN